MLDTNLPHDPSQPTAPLDSAHVGDIRGALGTIRQGDIQPWRTLGAKLRTLAHAIPFRTRLHGCRSGCHRPWRLGAAVLPSRIRSWEERLDGSDGPTVDGDLMPLDDPKPEPATSVRARVAPGPSERREPASSEVRQTPAGGQTGGKPEGGTPDGAEEGKRRD